MRSCKSEPTIFSNSSHWITRRTTLSDRASSSPGGHASRVCKLRTAGVDVKEFHILWRSLSNDTPIKSIHSLELRGVLVRSASHRNTSDQCPPSYLTTSNGESNELMTITYLFRRLEEGERLLCLERRHCIESRSSLRPKLIGSTEADLPAILD